MFAMESASAPSVGFELLLLCCERVQAVEIIKQGELGFSAQISGGAEQAIRLEPEIVRSEVINRRIYKQNLRHHNLYIHLLARSVYPPGVSIRPACILSWNISRMPDSYSLSTEQ